MTGGIRRPGQNMAGKKKGVVGIVGLGIMGGAFARNLVAANWRVIGYDVAVARRRAMASAGVEIAPMPAMSRGRRRRIIASLPNPSALAATVTAIVKAGVPRRVIIEASTFKLEDKRRPKRRCAKPVTSCSIARSAARAFRPR